MDNLTPAEKKRKRQKQYNVRTNYAAQKKYLANTQHSITFKFHKEADKDILEFFDKQDSKLAVLREAMRMYMSSK